jgi:hypothetical protein
VRNGAVRVASASRRLNTGCCVCLAAARRVKGVWSAKLSCVGEHARWAWGGVRGCGEWFANGGIRTRRIRAA